MSEQHQYLPNTLGFKSTATRITHCQSKVDVEDAVSAAQADELPLLVLGEGSNVVLGEALSASVLMLTHRDIQIFDNGEAVEVTVGAGMSWHGFVEAMVDQGLSGIENLALIPGTVGAAPVQNIGAYGVEAKDVLLSLLAFDTQTQSWRRFERAECLFSYRDSYFKSACPGRFIIYEVTFALSRNFVPRISYAGLEGADLAKGPRGVFEQVVAVRQSKLPDPKQLGNAGSFFENPIIPVEQYQSLKAQFPNLVAYADKEGYMKVAAGWLIDQAGWKGVTHGPVGVFDKQALVLVNHGGGDAKALLALAAEIVASVEQKFGITLVQEPRNYLS